jgi:hypothetical protein
MSGPAEVVAALAGIGEQPPPEGGPLTPAALIDTYCQPGMQSSWRTEEREDSMFHAGFCGYDGHQGFDDGHEWIANLTGSGWCALPALGDWPLVAFMFWPARPSDPRWAIAHYCEGDMAVEVFGDKDAANRGYARLRRQPAV